MTREEMRLLFLEGKIRLLKKTTSLKRGGGGQPQSPPFCTTLPNITFLSTENVDDYHMHQYAPIHFTLSLFFRASRYCQTRNSPYTKN